MGADVVDELDISEPQPDKHVVGVLYGYSINMDVDKLAGGMELHKELVLLLDVIVFVEVGVVLELGLVLVLVVLAVLVLVGLAVLALVVMHVLVVDEMGVSLPFVVSLEPTRVTEGGKIVKDAGKVKP